MKKVKKNKKRKCICEPMGPSEWSVLDNSKCPIHKKERRIKMPIFGYCMHCKKKNIEMKDSKAVILKNGRKATKGTCSICNGKMFKIGG